MKKKLVLLVLLSHAVWAQIPTGYYDTATGTGYTLKTQLRNIIANGYVTKSYDQLYDAYVTTDTDIFYENDNSVLDMYSENPTGTDHYNYQHYIRQCGTYTSENNCYNREHIFPQGFFNSLSPMVSDAHHVTPTDGYVNGRRSNYPFGKVNTASWTSLNGSKVGTSGTLGYTGTVFEPINEFKGDIARMQLYFAVRYENEVLAGGWDAHNSAPENPLNGTKDQFYEDWYIALLLSWHIQDPVSAREISRNNAVYTYQNNRNPFIDNPNYANQIWGNLVDTESPSIPTNLSSTNITSSGVTLNWTASTDNVGVTAYDIFKDNVLLASSSNATYNVSGLSPTTLYTFKVRAKDAAGNLSGFSNETNVTTLAGSGGGTSSELFISEYVEGSSNNKAIEIANYTGTSINLSSYSIKKQANGANGWVNELLLSGTLANNTVYVIANNLASSAVTSVAQLTVNGAPIDFNGNDPVGLFKNGVLIDIVGVLNVTTNFAADITLRRKSTITAPNTSYTISEWDSFAVDTFTGLGNHTITLSVNEYLNSKFTVYPNPTKNQTVFISVDNSIQVKNMEVMQITGKLIKSFKNPIIENNIFKISDLPSGFYILKMETDQGNAHKKIIVN
jgi:endonuclease I